MVQKYHLPNQTSHKATQEQMDMFKQYRPIEWLAIDIANHFGLDKLVYEERIDWVKQNLDQLETLTDQADEPMLYSKAVSALRDVQQGKPTNHSVSLDSVCSGIQIMSAVMRCKNGASITGLIHPNQRSDAYTAITKQINQLLNKEIQITRQQAKDAIMPAMYGSKKKPKEIFGEDNYQTFLKAMEIQAKGAMELLEILRNTWNNETLYHAWIMPDGHYVKCPNLIKERKRLTINELKYTPVCTITTNRPIYKKRESANSNIANIVHSLDAYLLRSLIRRCNYKPKEIKRFLTLAKGVKTKRIDHSLWIVEKYQETKMPDISYIKHLDKTNIHKIPTSLRNQLIQISEQILTHEPFEIIPIHDCFQCHPNHCNQLRLHYNHILAELSYSNVIDDIVNQFYNQKELLPKGRSIAKHIRQSNYAIC